jgi:tRNA-splicing ligase RtcB
MKVFGSHDDKTIAQLARCMEDDRVAGGVLCADGHLGYSQPIGGVIAYRGAVSPSGVGYDIGCGNTAIRLDMLRSDMSGVETSVILADIARVISFGVGRVNEEKVEHELFDNARLWSEGLVEDLRPMAQAQLGTVGSGNHYVDLFEDEEGYVWIGVHFGSRGLGHKTATRYLEWAGGKDSIDAPPTVINTDTALGAGYLAAMELAGLYAKVGREWVCERVRRMIGGGQTFYVNNHHNYAWLEEHGGEMVYVVRKGATPAFPGQRGFVGGSMGDNAVIIEGVDSEQSREALYSTVHGAGRVMSRTQAIGKRVKVDGVKTRLPGLVQPEAMQEWLRGAGVTLHGGGLDEAPQAYRRLPDVLEAHEGTISVLHTLRPFGVVMAGANEFDPYKD